MAVEKFLDPKNDFAFKKIFGTEKHKDILIHFLNDMLDLKEGKRIADVQFLKTSQDPDIAIKKQSIVDVLCKDEKGSQYIVEMQVAHTSGFEKRAQFYAARAYTNQMRAGEAYHDLKEIIFLAITDFVMFPEKPGYRSTHVTLDCASLTRDLKDFYFSFLELPKFTKTVDELETLVDKWAYFFKHASHTTPEELNKLTAQDLIFKEAYQAVDQYYWTEEELNTYEQEKKHALDARLILEYKLAQSLAEGEARGEAKERRSIALRLLQSGCEVAWVHDITQISLDELQLIRQTGE
ncbi:MAG: Rpn family recombination-promoting nuclease/putative transposase [Verrucomicrobia bacterium]|nr:Rpn family recombination-promoting nuclease/putative transposase [Verrucomicrobiota bacterium]